MVASGAPPTGDLAWNPGMCSDWELNRRPFGLQSHAQSIKLHQPGLCFFILVYSKVIGHVEVRRLGMLQSLNDCNFLQPLGMGGARQSLAITRSNQAVG